MKGVYNIKKPSLAKLQIQGKNAYRLDRKDYKNVRELVLATDTFLTTYVSHIKYTSVLQLSRTALILSKECIVVPSVTT